MKDKPGLVIFQQPPAWLAMAHAHAHDNQFDDKAPGGATTLNTPKPPGAGEPKSPSRAINLMNNYFDRVAKCLYAQEMIRGRCGTANGKLRFDIAPGSTVLIKNSPFRFIGNDTLTLDLLGSVKTVRIQIDAESATASTTFELDYVRTKEENESEATSIDAHPLFDDPQLQFTGAPLIHEYLFPS